MLCEDVIWEIISHITDPEDLIKVRRLSKKYNKNQRLRELVVNRAPWDYISVNATISEGFMREYQTEIRWSSVSKHQVMSEDFIREFADRLDWGVLCRSKFLSEQLMRDYHERLNWTWVIICQNLTHSFIDDFADMIDFKWLLLNLNTPQDVRQYYAIKYNLTMPT
ncbi:hypothetical protein BNJ_00118 [Kaumoebavirus]|uniref:hypothetical protein n=1 Tax=Kaumoebavirus TaxID=1859492 RepID=UPI0009C2B8CD|nr:hypothetical protein BNJ_00118 [Kaumoebavirus]ARA71952.1 hypothetical protein BNJ_00118 [Kaumoebavirus]